MQYRKIIAQTLHVSLCHCRVENKKTESTHMNPQKTTIAILAALTVSLALADDFKTNSGKEYKNATVTQVEADGIVIKTKGGISKLYFTELPKDVQERFHYDPAQAAAAQAAAVRQTQELNQFNSQQEELAKQQKAANAKQYQQGVEQNAIYKNVQSLTDQLSILQQQEQNLLVRIGQVEKRKEESWRRWLDGRGGQYDTSAEGESPVLRGNLENVRDEKKRVKEELARAQRVSR
jgi:hypothetical protein